MTSRRRGRLGPAVVSPRAAIISAFMESDMSQNHDDLERTNRVGEGQRVP